MRFPVKQITSKVHFMRNGFFILVSFLVSLSISCSPSIDLDQEIDSVDSKLQQLPKVQPNMLCPTVGFGSAIFPKPDHTSWLDIVLPEPKEIDTIVLIPALLKNTDGELETLGFPHRFTIEAWRNQQPGTQSVKLASNSWIYQAVGTYTPGEAPDGLIYELTLNQSRHDAGEAPVSVSLHYSTDFEPTDGLDVLNASGVVQVGETQIHQPWTEWAHTTVKHTPHTVSSKFDLHTIPQGATLYLRIANNSARGNATIDEVKINAPFNLINNDFETLEIGNQGVFHNIVDWYDTLEEWTTVQQSEFMSGPNYTSGDIVVDYSHTDYPNPGASPAVFPLPPGTIAQKVRIRSVEMQEEASWRKEQGHNFSINEVLLFKGMENVALNSQTASSDHENFPLMFHSNYSVDGYSYFPSVDPREVSNPQSELIYNETDTRKVLFDLGQTYTLDEARFYPVDRSPQFSHIYAMGIGFPRIINIQIGNEQDAKKAHTTIQIETPQQIGANALMHKLSNISGRYVWIEMEEGQRDPRTGDRALGFSEIELLQKGTNIVRGVQPLQPSGLKPLEQSHLTDGRTSSGIIMPQKEWLLKLNERAELEQIRIDLAQQKEQNALRQGQLLKLLQASILIILIAIIVITLIARSRHRQHLRQLRETIGSNLHDEVGANLSSIALSSEILSHSDRLEASKASRMIADIHRIASQTATEIRLLSRFLERQDVESNLIGQLRRIQNQMLPNLRTKSEYGAPDVFNALTPIEKWELVLFFKESLHNIVKHSNATAVEIRTHSSNRRLHLEISDNGHGLKDGSPAPSHLVKRAKKLKAELSIDSAIANGTNIKLSIPQKRRLKK